MSQSAIDYSPREDDLGKIVFMVRSGGYVMCKRPRCAPFVLSEKEWARLPRLGDQSAFEYRATKNGLVKPDRATHPQDKEESR